MEETKNKKCIGCPSINLMGYEDIGEGKFCQKCFDKEMKIWEREANPEYENLEENEKGGLKENGI